jgi:PKHD-type hydroxylase
MELGSFFSVKKVFTSEECDRIIRTYSNFGSTSGTVINGPAARKSHHYFIDHVEDTDWIYMRLASFVEYFNTEKFKFNIDRQFQNIQFTTYETGDYYKWHVDAGPSPDTCIRKLSLSVQLSYEKSYEGGDLQFGNSDDEVFKADREKGSVTIFPSIIRHQVAPVTRGKRYSLVAWVTGAPFQ